MPRQKMNLEQCITQAEKIQRQEAIEEAADRILPDIDKPGKYNVNFGNIRPNTYIVIMDGIENVRDEVVRQLDEMYDVIGMLGYDDRYPLIDLDENQYIIATNLLQIVITDYEEEY